MHHDGTLLAIAYASLAIAASAISLPGTATAQSREASVPNDPLQIDAATVSPELRKLLRERALSASGSPFAGAISDAAQKPTIEAMPLSIEREALRDSLEKAGGGVSHIGLISGSDRFRSPSWNVPVHVQQVREPIVSNHEIDTDIAIIKLECRREADARRERYDDCVARRHLAELKGIQTDVSGAVADGTCTTTASAYKNYLAKYCTSICPADPVVFGRFDDECMYSLIPWRRKDGQMKRDPQPVAFHQGGDRDGVRGILDAVALIEIVDVNTRTPFCGALLLSGNRVLTARHCFESLTVQEAWRAGRIYMRLIRDTAGQGWPLIAQPVSFGSNTTPAMDSLVVAVDSATPIAAPAVRFLPATPGKALVLGYFRDFNRSRELEGSAPIAGVSAISTWRQGLRWSKDGLCHVTEVVDDCVRMHCQTVEGYSGAPVFPEQQKPGEPLTVFGVVSGPVNKNSRCGRHEEQTTMVAATTAVVP